MTKPTQAPPSGGNGTRDASAPPRGVGPLGIALGYAVTAGLWIVFSDRIAETLARGDSDVLTAIQTAKGWLFIAVTAFVLYALVKVRVATETRAAHEAREGERRFRAIFEGALDAMLLTDSRGAVADANAAASHLLGLPRDGIVGRTVGEFVADGTSATVEAAGTTRGELELVPAGRPRVWVEFSRRDDVVPGRRLWALRDVSERKRAERRLAGQMDVLEQLARGTPLHAVLARLCQVVEEEAPGGHAALLELQPDGASLSLVAGPRLPEGVRGPLELLPVTSGASPSAEAVLTKLPVLAVDAAARMPDSQLVRRLAAEGIRSIWSSPILSGRGDVLGTLDLYYPGEAAPSTTDLAVAESAVGLAGVALEREATERERRRLAYHDPLTGLPNRNLFDDRTAVALLHARQRGFVAAVLCVDIDRFKTVNESLGHRWGDELLRLVGARLAETVFDTDTVARHSGSEFLVLLSRAASQTDVARVVKKLMDRLAEPFVLDGREHFVSASVGVSLFPGDGTDSETLVRAASAALSRAKAQGGNRTEHYTASLNKKALERLILETRLRRAQDSGEFSLAYQPILDTGTRELAGAEALLRWNPPGGREVAPSEFIPLAEEIGLIVALGQWVLREACATAQRWQRPGRRPLRIGVNVSSRQLAGSDMVATVRQALAESGLPPDLLELEVTESSQLGEEPAIRSAVAALASLGVGLAMDDFGTGYSSMSYLKRLPLTTLKIDRSFVVDAARDPKDLAIVRSVVAMARAGRLRVVAEGVEEEEQLALVAREGCDEFQGFLIGPGVPREEFERTWGLC